MRGDPRPPTHRTVRRMASVGAGALTIHVLLMSMSGDTCSAMGTVSPSGFTKKVTRSPQGVLVTSTTARSMAGVSPFAAAL